MNSRLTPKYKLKTFTADRRLLAAVTLIAASLCSASASADLVYTFVSDDAMAGTGYGFSGTITTDGTTGSFTDSSSFNAIVTGWSITLTTPDAVDGNSSEVLSGPGPGGPLWSLNNPSGTDAVLNVTPTRMELTSGTVPISFIGLSISSPGFGTIGASGLSFAGPFPGGFGIPDNLGSISVNDNSETPGNGSANFGTLTSLTIATAVPEPSSIVLLGLATGWIGLRRRR